MTVALWEAIGGILVAVVAATGGVLGIVARYQSWRRKRQPVIADTAEWQKVVAAQEQWLTHIEEQLRLLSPTPGRNRYTQAYASLAAVDRWLEQTEAAPTPLLRLREGCMALDAYRELAVPLKHLQRLAPEEEEGGRPSWFRLRKVGRWLARRNAVAFERSAINALLRVQKHLAEISYLQPVLLGGPDVAADAAKIAEIAAEIAGDVRDAG